MVDKKIVGEWLSKADEDFEFAEANLKEESVYFAQICFHFHQAAEKYIKAFIVAHNLEFEKSHNLMHLLKLCARKDPALLTLLDTCEMLNTVYIDTRYPVHWPTDYNREKAGQARDAADQIGTALKKRLQR